MKHLVAATRKAVDEENWYAALTLALTIPDICGRLKNPTWKSQRRYEKWFDRYMLKYYQPAGTKVTFLTGPDCYALRCAFLHQGEFGIDGQSAKKVHSRFHFIGMTGMTVHCNIVNGALQLQVSQFCKEVCMGVEEWLADNSSDQKVQDGITALGYIHCPASDGSISL